jgi:hypothetical protein
VRRLLLLNAHALDLLTLLWAVSLYGSVQLEVNPLMRLAYATAGTGGIVVAKSAGVGFFVWAVGQRRRSLLTFGIVLGLIGALANLVAIGIIRGAL